MKPWSGTHERKRWQVSILSGNAHAVANKVERRRRRGDSHLV